MLHLDGRRGEVVFDGKGMRVEARSRVELTTGGGDTKGLAFALPVFSPFLCFAFALPTLVVILAPSLESIPLGPDLAFGDRVVATTLPTSVAETGTIATVAFLSPPRVSGCWAPA